MNELILQDFPDYPGLVDIGSCSIHVIHNAFGKGLEHYGKDVDQLCLDLYSLFKYSAARREDFKEVQVEMELDTNNFLQHTEVRWVKYWSINQENTRTMGCNHSLCCRVG